MSRDVQVIGSVGTFFFVTLFSDPTLAVVQCLGIPLRLFSRPNTAAYFGRPLRFFLAAGTFKFRRAPSYFFGRIPSLRLCLPFQVM